MTPKKIAAPIAVASRTFSKHAELRGQLLEYFSNVKFNDAGLSLAGPALVEFFKGCAGVIVALEKINASVLDGLPELKVVSKFGVGLDNVDLEQLKVRGVKLGWTGGVNARSVAELALTFAMGTARGVFSVIPRVASGQWSYPGGNILSGSTFGIVGGGHIGGDLARLLTVFDCRVLINDIVDKAELCRQTRARQVSLEELLTESDFVSLHVPYEPGTHHLISTKTLGLMRPGAILINTSRGGVVDEVALSAALESGRLRGSAADVFATEPPLDSPLLKLPNFVATPHIGGGSREAVLAMGTAAINNLVEAFALL